MSRTNRRFRRQFEALERLVPFIRGPLSILRRDSWRLVRIPLVLLLIAGGLLSFLPFLGLWMLPLGLLLLAVDIPMLRGPVSAVVIYGRRRVSGFLRRWRNRNKRRQIRAKASARRASRTIPPSTRRKR